MDFSSAFLQALQSEPLLPKGISPLVFLGSPYIILEETASDFLTILAGGTVEAREKYAFSLGPLDCRMLLYTKRGRGTLHIPGKTYHLDEGTLLYLDCTSPPFFKFEVSELFWQYTVFFIRGKAISDYESLAGFSQALLFMPAPYSAILSGLEKLLQYGNSVSLRSKLSESGILHDILTNIWIEGFQLEMQEEKYPSWLLEIKQSLDIFFMNPFRLEDLEERYHISKYRICREFSAAFGLPPLKYLNKRRIEAAKNLLLSGDKRIHEIAADVGYENTNHFINLFKKETGLTPLVYRNMF
ncbi:MAG: AraC family transcriptional regulator [Roseburia sp.]|nr:AraC family transcriptional regulator [Ruminococcus sp.]MCM1154790.1 AraC family transcriptional regulator [Roseburia sp.]MCM1242079.1 AraC family transcriptional regulator [Roseburia sp.]